MNNPVQDKKNPKNLFALERAVRGGMWDHGLYFLSGQMRHGNSPTARRFEGLGFRVVRSKQ